MLTRFANPARFMRVSILVLPWLGGSSAVVLGLGLFWSLVIAPPDYQQGESVRIMFVHVPAAIMAEAAHGTAPSLQGKNVANPMAMILAGAALLSHAGEEAQAAGRAIREACLEAVARGGRTADLGGHLGTAEFTDDVIGRVRSKLEVWAAL